MHTLVCTKTHLGVLFNTPVLRVHAPRSPDLTPCDFFLWGYLKNKVFTTSPENIDVLRQRIIEEFNALRQQPEMFDMRCAEYTDEPFVVSKEMGDMLKGTAHSLNINSINRCYV